MSWRALRVKRGGRWGWNTVVRETVRGRAGAYAFRDSSGQVLYVGESRTGARSAADLRMWKTITRHFQDPTGKWADHYTKHVGGKPFRRAVANDLEIQVWLTSPGQAALDEQARLIARLKPAHNVDDGRADVDTSFDFGANVKANPGDSQRPATLGEVWSALASAYGGWWRSAGVQVQGGVAYLVGASLTGYEGKKRRAAVDAAQGAAWLRWALRVHEERRRGPIEAYPTLASIKGLPILRTATAVLDDITGGRWWPHSVSSLQHPASRTSGAAPRTTPTEFGEFPVSIYVGDMRPAEALDRVDADYLAATLYLAAIQEAMAVIKTRGQAARAYDAAPVGSRQRWAYGALVDYLPPDKTKPAHRTESERKRRPAVIVAPAPAPAPAPVERPEGYGEASTHKGAPVGQTKMFNNPPTSPPAARREYERKHWGHKARGVARSLEVVDPSHGSLVELGRLDRVEYVTSKKGDPSRATYFHDFEGERPVLAFHVCDRARCPDRGKLVIAGGSYRVEDRGIVG